MLTVILKPSNKKCGNEMKTQLSSECNRIDFYTSIFVDLMKLLDRTGLFF